MPHFRGDSGAWSDPDGYFGPAGLRIDTLPVLSSYSVPKPTMFVATGCLHGIRASGGLDAAGLGVGGIQFVQADILEWTPPSHKFDQVAAHFVLDCFRSEQLERLVGRLAEVVMPEVRWLLSDFCEPLAGLAKWRARLILEAMYLFFGWPTGLSADQLTAPDPLLVRRGFVLRQRHLFEWGLLHADLWDLQPPGVMVSPEIGNDDVGFKV